MKTIGPLHLEDLEPHRFEDLVRQLLYDFRTWAQIEAVGRSGSDQGFDVRAQEVSNLDDGQLEESNDELNPSELYTLTINKVWVIQCKREKSIGPRKLATYMAELPDVRQHGLYGVIFVAACDFSFAARDIFRRTAIEQGFTEAYLWGKGEIEDQLFQPKNDHLLFAYFGISLQTRKRSIITFIRAKLAAKRKAIRILEKSDNRHVLIRDASDERYPHADGNDAPGHRARGRWCLAQFERVVAQGVLFKLTEQFAYMADDQKSWDYMESLNTASLSSYEDYWASQEEDIDSSKPSQFDNWDVWSALPENNKAKYLEYGIIPYENIIDIDESGDQFFEGPHLYITPYDPSKGPFKDGKRLRVQLERGWDDIMIKALPEHRVIWFQNIKEQAEKIRLERGDFPPLLG